MVALKSSFSCFWDLDHAIQFLPPCYRMDVKILESVQRKMAKIQELRNFPYEDSFEQLNLHSLERRKVRGDLTEFK